MQLGLLGESVGSQLRRAIRLLTDRHGLQEVAAVVGMTPSALCHALNQSRTSDGRLKRRIPIEALPELVALEGGEVIVDILWRCAARPMRTMRARTGPMQPGLRIVKGGK